MLEQKLCGKEKRLQMLRKTYCNLVAPLNYWMHPIVLLIPVFQWSLSTSSLQLISMYIPCGKKLTEQSDAFQTIDLGYFWLKSGWLRIDTQSISQSNENSLTTNLRSKDKKNYWSRNNLKIDPRKEIQEYGSAFLNSRVFYENHENNYRKRNDDSIIFISET